MRSTLAFATTLVGVAVAAPQAVTEPISPTAAAPAECTGSLDGNFEITVTQPLKRGLPEIERRAECGGDGILVISVKDNAVYDSLDRTGYIASNFQFQFDGPPQAGALFTSGFSVCPGNVLALGDSTTFYRCLSGDFYNLYDRDWAEQCEPVSIVAVPCGTGEAASQIPDGQVIGTSVVQTTIVTALSDGQPQVVTTEVPIPLCQISDGQLQVKTTPCASVTAAPTTSYIPVSESSDGQIIATSPGSVPPPPATTTEAPVPTSYPTTAPPETTAPPATTSVEAPSSSSAVESSSESSSEVPSTTESSSTPVESTPAPSQPAETPPTSGSSSAAAGSFGALVVGLLVAFVCL